MSAHKPDTPENHIGSYKWYKPSNQWSHTLLKYGLYLTDMGVISSMTCFANIIPNLQVLLVGDIDLIAEFSDIWCFTVSEMSAYVWCVWMKMLSVECIHIYDSLGNLSVFVMLVQVFWQQAQFIMSNHILFTDKPELECSRRVLSKIGRKNVQVTCKGKMNPPPTTRSWSWGKKPNRTLLINDEEKPGYKAGVKVSSHSPELY